MKLPTSSLRKSAGATLGLVAASIFVLISVGVFMFYAGRVISGSAELNHASDSGALNAAKQAIVKVAVALNDPTLPGQGVLPYSDFAAFIPDQQINGAPAIDLLTYNRVVAQAVVVGLAAQNIGLDISMQHAQLVAAAVQNIGQRLQALLANGSLNSSYDELATQNTLSMLGNAPVLNRIGNLQPVYTAIGRPSNIYFYPDMVNPTASTAAQEEAALSNIAQNSSPTDPSPNQVTATAGDAYKPVGENIFYAQGYRPIFFGLGTSHEFALSFIPNNPQDTTHLIDPIRAIEGANSPAGLPWVPPNALKANAAAEGNITGSGIKQNNSDASAISAISTAIIGCGLELPGGGGPQDQAARIPAGFLRIYNLPSLEQTGSQPLGPVLAGQTVDGSQSLFNNSAFGSGSTVYVATPIPMNADGSVNLNSVIYGTSNDAATLTCFSNWINFNTHFLASNDPNYNIDVVNGQHRNPSIDFFTSPNSGQLLIAGQNPQSPHLFEGPTQGNLAHLSDLVNITGYAEIKSTTADSNSSITATDGTVISGDVVMNIATEVAGPGLGEPSPSFITVNVPASNLGTTAIEYLKGAVIRNFKTNYHEGHYSMIAPQSSLETGLKNFDWWDNSGALISWSSPQSQTSGLNDLNAVQFMHIDTPYNLFSNIDQIITHDGGYVTDQVTLNDWYNQIYNSFCKYVNPKWTVVDLQNALNSAKIPLGSCMYLRDDGAGNLIFTDNCPQDPGLFALSTDATLGNSTGLSQLVDFATIQGQFLPTIGTLIDTKIDPSSDAPKGDAWVEDAPYKNASGNVAYEAGAILYKSCGYSNLLGEIDLYSRPSADVNVYFSQEN